MLWFQNCSIPPRIQCIYMAIQICILEKKEKKPTKFTLIYFTFLPHTRDTKELLMSHSILVKFGFIDKNKQCKKDAMLVLKIGVLHWLPPAFLWDPGMFSDMHVPMGQEAKLPYNVEIYIR